MARADTYGFAVDLSARLTSLEELLASNPASAVGAFDAAHNLIEAGPALARVGIRVDGHPPLKTGLLAEYLAVSDVWLVGDAALEAGVHGSATRPVRLRDDQPADERWTEPPYPCSMAASTLISSRPHARTCSRCAA